MCGIAGAVEKNNTREKWRNTLFAMGKSIEHRGPDDSGIWFDEKAGVGFAHQRLSIIDLSEHGKQPMISKSGRFVIAYNGEIYNFLHIKDMLSSYSVPWQGGSDTEVVLAAIDIWGLEKAIEKFIGMFAFALFDKQEQKIFLVRDRLGIKPLYYSIFPKKIIFGSELKPIKLYPGFEKKINRDVLALFLRHNYIPAPYSIYKNTYKLTPGSILEICLKSFDIKENTFWSAKDQALKGQNKPYQLDESNAVKDLESLLLHAVKIRMISDVPLGAFLSGGIDSTTITAMMQSLSSTPVRTFSIGFHEKEYNESQHARAIARYLGTDHTELIVSPEQLLDVVPKISSIFDEPFSDSSQIPTYLLALLTREHVTVSLSGDGGDELFGGYLRYNLGHDLWKKIGRLPVVMRKFLAGFIEIIPMGLLDKYGQNIAKTAGRYSASGTAGAKVRALAEILAASDFEDLYKRLVSHWKFPDAIVIASKEAASLFDFSKDLDRFHDLYHRMMFLDLVTYLPDDILAKVDRTTMAVSLEARVPVLDHRVVEFAWKLPLSMKVKEQDNKWILKQVLYKYVPEELVNRPKMGFGIPIDQWLRSSLRDWAESLLDESTLKQEGFFNTEMIRRKLDEHVKGIRNWHYYLWDILMFQEWLHKCH